MAKKAGKPRIQQTAQEMRTHLRESIQIMLRAAKYFDEGHEYEAKVLATQIRVLLHDAGQGTSLLRGMNIISGDARYNIKNIQFHNTSGNVNPRNLLPHDFFLSQLVSSEGVRYVAPLDENPPVEVAHEGFEDWWANRVVLIDSLKNQFSRKNLVLCIANQAGGAHVDPGIDEDYYRLTRQNSMGWKFVKMQGDTRADVKGPDNQIGHVAVRQIAHEVLKTLFHVVPECYPAPYETTLLSIK